MGYDAKADLWVGVRSNECDIDSIMKKVEPHVGEDEEVWNFECGQELVGYGAPIFWHDWDNGVAAFDVVDVTGKIEAAKALMRRLFDAAGVDAEIGVWFQTDWR